MSKRYSLMLGKVFGISTGVADNAVESFDVLFFEGFI